MTDCLLINSPDALLSSHYEADPKMPLGLLYIASYLESRGYSVALCDFHMQPFTHEELYARVVSHKPRLIGINSMTPNRRVVFEIINKLKNEFSGIPIVVGGPHATSFPEDFMEHCPSLDVVAIGEGELSTLALLQRLPNLEGIPGLFTRKDYISHAPKKNAERIVELDALPFPDFGLVDLEKYLKVSRELYLTCSRGCRYDCAFCSIRTLLGRSIQYRQASNVIEEMKQLRAKYGVDRFYFYDDDFIVWPELRNFCRANSTTGMKWTAQATINDISRDDIPLLGESGCYRMSFGFESGSYRIQKYLGKIIKPRALQRIEEFKRQGVQTRGYFIMGFPNETLDDIADTLEFIGKLKRLGLGDIAVFPARPYPGTRMFTECVEKFGEGKIQELLDFYYVNDYGEYAGEVMHKLHRYNTLPIFQLNERFTAQNLRHFIALAFTMFFEGKYLDYSRGDLVSLLDDIVAQGSGQRGRASELRVANSPI